eukprot:SM000194S04828  [mRNA]  locus=s194:199628:201345:- [translate_table: standard]
MQIGIQLMTKMVQYCQLLRYAYPAYGDIVEPPLCGLLQGGKFNLAFRVDQNLAQAAIALFDLREAAAGAGADAGGGGALNLGQGLSLVKVGNPESPVPGVPIDLAKFKATGVATFRLDVSDAPWSLHDQAGLWPQLRFYSQMRMLAAKVYLEGATFPKSGSDLNCAHPVVGFNIKLRSPFQQWYVDSDGHSHIQSYHLNPKSTSYAYSPKFACAGHSCDDPVRDDVCTAFAGGSPTPCSNGGYAPWTGGEAAYFPTPFCEWELTVVNKFGCTSLDNVTDILLSLDLYAVDSGGELAVPQTLLNNADTYPETTADLPYAAYPALCSKTSMLGDGVQGSLCSKAQICSDPDFVARLAATIAGQAAPGVVSTIAAISDGADHWVELQDPTALCAETVSPPQGAGPNRTRAQAAICCAGAGQAPYTAATYPLQLLPAPPAAPPPPYVPPPPPPPTAPPAPVVTPASSPPPPAPAVDRKGQTPPIIAGAPPTAFEIVQGPVGGTRGTRFFQVPPPPAPSVFAGLRARNPFP